MLSTEQIQELVAFYNRMPYHRHPIRLRSGKAIAFWQKDEMWVVKQFFSHDSQQRSAPTIAAFESIEGLVNWLNSNGAEC